MRRREFMTLLGGAAAAWPLPVGAQLERVRTIGYLNPGRPVPQMYVPFVEALRQLGWIEGKNLVIDDRYSNNDVERLHQLAAELVRLNVDVIVATGTLGPLAAKRATANIPIVMTAAGDPLGTGLVASLARPTLLGESHRFRLTDWSEINPFACKRAQNNCRSLHPSHRFLGCTMRSVGSRLVEHETPGVYTVIR
jgi:hypothetical protein